MKINANQVFDQGLSLREQVNPLDLGIENDIVRFKQPLLISADISRITNTVTVALSLSSKLEMTCSRCLEEFEADLQKSLRVIYAVNAASPIIDMGPQIREEIIIDYPFKPLCKQDCKGLCPNCGKNLNLETCNCK